VVTGAMLGLGRVVGDTAVVVLLLGATLRLNPIGDVPVLGALRGTGGTLTTYVYANAPTGEANQPTKAYAAAFVLLAIVLSINFIVDVAVRRGRRMGWGS
jgi:phosphate transport system permease protein